MILGLDRWKGPANLRAWLLRLRALLQGRQVPHPLRRRLVGVFRDFYRSVDLQGEVESRAAPDPGDAPDSATVHLYESPHDRQTQPRATHVARAGSIHLVEGLEDAANLTGRDTLARVLNPEMDGPGAKGLAENYGAPLA